MEAINAGKDALNITNSILSSLNKAQDWGVLDMVGGDFVSTMVKNGHLDDAQSKLQRLQKALSKFKVELADIKINMDNVQVNTDGFIRMADYFFDGLFVDFAVQNKINNSRSTLKEVENKISMVLEKLKVINRDLDNKETGLKNELEYFVKNINSVVLPK